MRRHPREWFSTKPDIDEDTERPTRWWHWRREWNGPEPYGPRWRWRLIVGDIMADAESDAGEPVGVRFGVDAGLWEDTGQFAESGYTDPTWHDHSVTVVCWRWGVHFAWRAGRK